MRGENNVCMHSKYNRKYYALLDKFPYLIINLIICIIGTTKIILMTFLIDLQRYI